MTISPEKLAKAIAESRLWTGAWDGMCEEERNTHRQRAEAVLPLLQAEVQAAVGAVLSDLTKMCERRVEQFSTILNETVGSHVSTLILKQIMAEAGGFAWAVSQYKPDALKALEEHDAAEYLKTFQGTLELAALVIRGDISSGTHSSEVARRLQAALARRLAQETVKAFEAVHEQNCSDVDCRCSIAKHPDYLAARAALEKAAGS